MVYLISMSDPAGWISGVVLSNNSAFSLMKFLCIRDICCISLSLRLAATAAFRFFSFSCFSAAVGG